jgi:hypothetical protein
VVLLQCRHASATANWIKRRNDARECFRQADEAATPDYVLIGELGAALKALVQKGLELELTEGDYTTLGARHEALVRETKEICAALVQARGYEELAKQASMLKELRACVGDWIRMEVDALDLPDGKDADY